MKEEGSEGRTCKKGRDWNENKIKNEENMEGLKDIREKGRKKKKR